MAERSVSYARDLASWFWRLVTLRPHQLIGNEGEGLNVDHVYLRRWFLVPSNHVFNVYLHHFKASDDDRALHDHPWDSVSILIKGELLEHVDTLPGISASTDVLPRVIHHRAPAIVNRTAEHTHRLELIGGNPAWTIFITGRKRRRWGFWCKTGWMHWKVFTAHDGTGRSMGCGDE
ncbi:MAG: hypothetical protein AAGI44_03040 [Pseudomonadota bacterium]